MESITVFGINLGQYLTGDNFRVLLRLLVLIFIGLPVIYLLSRWIRKYLINKTTAQQAMIFEKVVFYVGVIIILISILNDFGFKLSHLLGAAGIFGIAIGAGLSWLVGLAIRELGGFISWRFFFPLSAVFMGVGVAGVVGLVFGLYPANQAAKKSPIEALRYE